MRIGIDISTLLNHGKDIGAGRYIYNLLKNLFKIDKEDTFVLTARCTTGDYLYLLDELKENKTETRIFNISQKKLMLWDRAGFPPVEMLGVRADVLHFPDFLIAPAFNRNIVLTIHDLAFMRFPELNFDWFINKYKKLVLKNSARAKRIIAVSESTRKDIVDFFGTDGKKISVIHEAAEEKFKKLKPQSLDRNILSKFKISKRYILSVGTIEPRKNYVSLIKAFNIIKSLSPGKTGFQLVIAGRTGWKSEPVYEEYEKSPFRQDIIFTGRLNDDELVQLYNMAELFVYPSIFEGFGLPVIEAMQCGCAVLASNTSSIPEIVSDINMLFDPHDSNQIAEKIITVLNDEKIRQQFAKKSIERASHFSWEKTALQTLEVYRSAL